MMTEEEKLEKEQYGNKPDWIKIIDSALLIVLIILVVFAWIDGHFISNTTIIQEVCQGVPKILGNISVNLSQLGGLQ